MTVIAARVLIVPDWWMSKCGGRIVTPMRSTPPDFGLGSGALSWNFDPSYSSGISSAANAGSHDSP